MQNFRNYYEILDIPKTATEDEIKQSFRRLARQCHPDLNPGNKAAEEQFKVIGEAYEILSDPDRRARYDQFSQYWKQKGFQSNPSRRSNSG
jgi:curved DNA-binding protein